MISKANQILKMSLLSQKMRMDWDDRSRENALHYVNTERDDWNEADFFETGRQNVADQVLADIEAVCDGRDPLSMRVLEIGCGVGRMTRALADLFGEVHAVDISEEMVRRARRYLRKTHNAHVRRNSGRDLRVLGDLRFDFAFSFIVFQHIPSREIIDGYVAEVGRLLVPGGLFKFQVQGHPGPPPRSLLPSTWLGASVSESEAKEMASRHGFELERSVGNGTQYYWLWFRKLPSGS